MKKYIVKLTTKERRQLQDMTRKGRRSARVIKRAHILLISNAGKTDDHIAHTIGVSSKTVGRIRERWHKGGIERALYDEPRPGIPRALNDNQEAHLVAIACSDPPEGRIRWTIELMRERLIADGVTNAVSVGTIHARLTQRGIKPWREKNVVCAKTHT